MASKENDPRDDEVRNNPQRIFDQRETQQVGGTVMNLNLNRDEYKVDQEAVAKRRGDGSSSEDHNLNELEDE